jgi:hypothetical protein
MRKLLLAAVAVGGLLGLTGLNASAAPSGAGLHIATDQGPVTRVQYYYNHHHYHHRHWYHDHWHYY